MDRSIWIGFDPREAAAFAVTRHSVRKRMTTDIPVHGIVLDRLRNNLLFTRPQEKRGGVIWDMISGAPCATEFSISRFLIKELHYRAAMPMSPSIGDADLGDRLKFLAEKPAMERRARSGWALFMDCDMLVRDDIAKVFALCEANNDKAIMCVKHDHRPADVVKMDGQVQTVYARKNWSSFFAVNCGHPANEALTVDLVNTLPGRDLHRFSWIEDDNLIGGLPEAWNWLAGHSSPAIAPSNVHHTEGSPCLPGYENAPYADEWRRVLADWAVGDGMRVKDGW